MVKIDAVDDFYQPVQRILEKVGCEKVKEIYDVGEFEDINQFWEIWL